MFEDADIEKAVEWAMFGIFWTVGQVGRSVMAFLGVQQASRASGRSILCFRLATSSITTPPCATMLSEPPPASPPTNPHPQICSATSRLLVHESIAPAFFARLKKRAESIKARPFNPFACGAICVACFRADRQTYNHNTQRPERGPWPQSMQWVADWHSLLRDRSLPALSRRCAPHQGRPAKPRHAFHQLLR